MWPKCEVMWCIRWHYFTMFHSQENSAIGRWNSTFWQWSRKQTHAVRSDQYSVCTYVSCVVFPLTSHRNTNILKCSCRIDQTACLMTSKLQCYNCSCAVALSLVASLSLRGPGLDPKPGHLGFVADFSLQLTRSFHQHYIAYFCQYHSTNIT